MATQIERTAKQVELSGYAVVPDLLDEDRLRQLRNDLKPIFDAIGSRESAEVWAANDPHSQSLGQDEGRR